MEKIRILYDLQHWFLEKHIDRFVDKLEADSGVSIDMKIAHRFNLIPLLSSNPNYNFVILHLGNSIEGTYRQAEKCSRLTNAVLVAESSIHPRGKTEVLQHFHEYIPIIYKKKDNFLELLNKYGFSPSGEEPRH